jgi:hypothetical protein
LGLVCRGGPTPGLVHEILSQSIVYFIRLAKSRRFG